MVTAALFYANQQRTALGEVTGKLHHITFDDGNYAYRTFRHCTWGVPTISAKEGRELYAPVWLGLCFFFKLFSIREGVGQGGEQVNQIPLGKRGHPPYLVLKSNGNRARSCLEFEGTFIPVWTVCAKGM